MLTGVEFVHKHTQKEQAKKLTWLTPGVARNTLKADDVSVNEWIKDWALTPVNIYMYTLQYKFVYYETPPLNPKAQPPYIPNTKFTALKSLYFYLHRASFKSL